MLAPVLSSSLTTVAAFVPLMAVSGIIGSILFDIPFVVICVILASLVESFLVLPGHLTHSFRRAHHKEPSPLRARLDAAFDRFRDNRFRPLVEAAVRRPSVTLAFALASLILTVGLIAGGRLGFTFFPTVEGNVIYASASFVSGTPPERVENFIQGVERALYETEEVLGGGLIRVARVNHGMGIFSNTTSGRAGDQFASITVELVPSDERTVRNEQFLQEWRKRFEEVPGLERMTLSSRRGGGPPGKDLEIKLTGTDTLSLKGAALELVSVLETLEGVSGIEDDMPYGYQQLVFELTPMGRSRGLTERDVASQLSDALFGNLSQIFIKGRDEIEVRVMLPDDERHALATLDSLQLQLPGGGFMPLMTAVKLEPHQGFEILRHYNGRLSATVFADVDRTRNNANRIREQLRKKVIPELEGKWGVEAKLHRTCRGSEGDPGGYEAGCALRPGHDLHRAGLGIRLLWLAAGGDERHSLWHRRRPGGALGHGHRTHHPLLLRHLRSGGYRGERLHHPGGLLQAPAGEGGAHGKGHFRGGPASACVPCCSPR